MKNDLLRAKLKQISATRRGKDWWARCLWHQEKTPSMKVSESGGYKCFGCGEAGDNILKDAP